LEGVLREAGFAIVAPDEAAVVLVPLREPADCERVEETAHRAQIVALLPDAGPGPYAHALRHGAVGAAAFDDDPEQIVTVVAAAVSGVVCMPVATATALAWWGPEQHGYGPVVGPDELEWLLELSRGGTVVKLAERYGYSERAMFRKLADLYARLGVSGRAEALVAADRFGLLPGRRVD
jgi:DNA-binding NarL/FixJ family response regulator